MDTNRIGDVLLMTVMICTILFPILIGVFISLHREDRIKRNALCVITGISLCIEAVLVAVCLFGVPEETYHLFNLTNTLAVDMKLDLVGRIFAGIMAIVWTLTGFYCFEYMKHEENNKRFFGFYLMVEGILMGLCFAGNFVTYYGFFELLTIGSFALVLHNRSHEALMAALKYLFYSFAGAYMVLFGLFFVYKYSGNSTMSFSLGGIIDSSTFENTGVLGVALLLMIIGFGVKAGMFPMQGWLPTAHPVAPAPASAVLSGIIVKAGVLGILRVIYYIFGENNFGGSYAQTVVLILSLITVFIGSMLAYKEKVLKKRLAYSTVSQVSYILFGLFVLNPTAYEGSLIHVVAHAAIKSTLFLCAGAIIYLTGCTKVNELRGIGKKMPVMLWCYTIVSLGLIGIPPFGGFASKWYLCVGALNSNIKVFSWLGPVVLLVSALLTAGYLLPISINGFMPGKDFKIEENEALSKAHEPKLIMLVPIIVLTLISIFIGVFPEVLIW